jgi:hypothetical protein
LDFPSPFYSALSLAGYVPVTTVTGWKSCRYAMPSLGPEAFGLQAAPFSKISESPVSFNTLHLPIIPLWHVPPQRFATNYLQYGHLCFTLRQLYAD